MNEADEQLSVAQAAVLYGCSKTNMSYLIASQRIPFERVGNKSLVKKSDVLALRKARDERAQQNQWIAPIKRSA